MDIQAWLALTLAPGLDADTLSGLLARHGDAATLVRAARTDSSLPAPLGSALAHPDPARLARAEAWLNQPGCHLLPLVDPRYPRLLRETRRPPVSLFVQGDPEILSLPQIAMVGSRRATPAAVDTARAFASYLAARGFCITSGLAEGIDAAAHEGALAASGLTIAVCGTGPDVVYPRQHAGLAAAIVAGGGALVSEFAPGTPVQRSNFPRRNRIISGLCAGTLVVEAGMQSGALVTARHAAEQGREVFAIPGSIHNPLVRGCHFLIRNGAKLVETAQDIVEELPPLLRALGSTAAPAAPAREQEMSDPAYGQLLAALGFDPVSVDTLVERCGLTTGEVSSMLLLLEMQGVVRSLAGGRYQRVKRSVDL